MIIKRGAGIGADDDVHPGIDGLPKVFHVRGFIIFYFLLIRPQRQKEKDHQKRISELKKNDEVVTIGGIHGTIVNVKDKTFVLRIGDDTRVEIDKTAVGKILKT